MLGVRLIQPARMMLLAATVIVALASANAANQQMQVVRYYNGNVVPHGSAMSSAMDATAARVSALAGGMTQQGADDRSFKIIPKVIAIKAIKKHKKHKKGKKNLKSTILKGLPALFPLFGGAAIGSALTSAAATGAKGAAPVPASPLGQATYTATVPENLDIPVWKVHKYNGIDIRPVRLSEIIPLPPPSEIAEYKEVGEAPKDIVVPAPVYGPPETYPTPADSVVFPENPSPPAQTYGVPAQTYGVPAQTYGAPAQTYGVPAQTYGVPAQTYNVPTQTFNVPSQSFNVPTQTFNVPSMTYTVPLSQSFSVPVQQGFTGQVSQPIPSAENISPPTDEASNAATAESLEALSNLGALTDLIPGGGDSSSLLPGLFGVSTPSRVPFSFFNRFIRGPQSAALTADTPAEDASTDAFRQPSQSTIQSLLGRIPIISSLTSFGSGNSATHVNIPPLPELPALPDIQNVRGPNVQIPQIPHIRLPTRYVVRGTPYITIRTPSQPPATPYNFEIKPAPAPEPVTQTEAPVVEPVKPEPSYPLPLEQPQPQSQSQYGLVNSYGQPVQTGYYVTPVIAAPAPPQFAVPFYPTPVAGVPASQYGLPGGDSSVAASEIDSTTATECADDKACSQGVLKVAEPEGVTRPVAKTQTLAAPSPVFKKEEVMNVKLEDMTKYLDPRHVAAPKTPSVSPVVEGVDAQPSTNTDADEEESS